MNNPGIRNAVDKLSAELLRGEVENSYTAALETAQVLRQVVTKQRWTSAQAIIEDVQQVGAELMEARPLEFAVGNIVRRVLFIIREEYHIQRKEAEMSVVVTPAADGEGVFPAALAGDVSLDESGNALNTQTSILARTQMSPSGSPRLLSMDSSAVLSPALTSILEDHDNKDYTHEHDIRSSVIEGLNELITEMESTYGSIAEQALEHIHTNEVIMTIGRSKVVESFLLNAARKRKFSVVVAESAPSYAGQELAVKLSEKGVDTTLITDAAVFAMMARVNKVIVGCHAVLANGGVMSLVGGHMVALAAQHYSVPFVVCSGMYKLTPVFPNSQDKLNILTSPEPVMNYEDADAIDGVGVVNPVFDYIPPELVGLFISNYGGHNPSYVYRLLKEYYNEDDYNLK